MRATYVLAGMSALIIALAGCNGTDNDSDQFAGSAVLGERCGGQVPGATLRVTRQAGPPNSATIELPALSSVCLSIETNAASAKVLLDGARVVGPSFFKNRPIEMNVLVSELQPTVHDLTIEIAGRRGSFVEVVVHYAAPPPDSRPQILTVDDAIVVGQALLQELGQFSLFDRWSTSIATQATPLFSEDGVHLAFEVQVAEANRSPAGYLVLEVDELRPLLSSGAPRGPSLSDQLRNDYLGMFSQELPSDSIFLWSGAGSGVMAVQTHDPEGVPLRLSTCPECPADYRDERIPRVDLDIINVGDWLDARRARIAALRDDLPVIGQQTDALTCDFGNSGEDFCPSDFDDADLPTNGSVYISDPEGAFTLFYQQKRDWPSFDKSTGDSPDKKCSTGCTPVALLTLLDYWERHGYSYIIGAVNQIDTLTMSDADEDRREAILDDLRTRMETYCSDEEGSTSAGTPNANTVKIGEYLAERVDSLDQDIVHNWEVERTTPGWLARLWTIKSEINESRPLLVSYVSNWRDLVEDPEEETTRHTAVIYGYYDDGNLAAFDDLYVVRTGWRGTENHPVVRVEPIVGTGKTHLTTVRPPVCRPGGEPPICKSYPDVPQDHWGYQPVAALSCECVLEGRRDGLFHPNENVSRAEMIKIATVLAFPGIVEAAVDVDIADVKPRDWFSAFVARAHETGAIDHMIDDSGNLEPNRDITRAETAVLLTLLGRDEDASASFRHLARQLACELLEPQQARYADVNWSVPGYLSIMAASRACVFEGYVDGTFQPEGYLSRVEAAKVACFAAYGYGSDMCGDSSGTCNPLPLCGQ